jgi:peptidoglycan hydrolase CwlO-like protein
MSEANELEILRARKAELEAESRALKMTKKNIESHVKELEEQVAIEELEKNNKTLRDIVNQLESKKTQLENKLKDKTRTQGNPALKENKPSEGTNPPESPPAREANETSEAVVEENSEDVVIFEGIDPESLLENEEIIEDQEKTPEKKKRRFF